MRSISLESPPKGVVEGANDRPAEPISIDPITRRRLREVNIYV
jgi:hypothetical protein